MKLRIRANSLRFRLTRGDVDRLRDDGYVREITSFGVRGPALIVTLATDPSLDSTAAVLEDCHICVRVPATEIAVWATSEQIGVYGSQPTEGEPLMIAIEKDFQCLVPRAGDDADPDAYPNPKAKPT